MENEENHMEASTIVPVDSNESQRYCWVCFATEEDDKTAQWVQPCMCRGSSKWVQHLQLIYILLFI